MSLISVFFNLYNISAVKCLTLDNLNFRHVLFGGEKKMNVSYKVWDIKALQLEPKGKKENTVLNHLLHVNMVLRAWQGLRLNKSLNVKSCLPPAPPPSRNRSSCFPPPGRKTVRSSATETSAPLAPGRWALSSLETVGSSPKLLPVETNVSGEWIQRRNGIKGSKSEQYSSSVWATLLYLSCTDSKRSGFKTHEQRTHFLFCPFKVKSQLAREMGVGGGGGPVVSWLKAFYEF